MDYQTLMNFVPIPDLLKMKKVLFVGPHPDDIEISSGGIISKYVNLGIKVKFLITTDGGAGSNNPNLPIQELVKIRKEESINAAKFLNVEDVEVLNFEDGGIYDVDKMAVEIAKRIIEFSPNAVFCPDPHLPTETHPDHLNTAKATQKALLISKFKNSALRCGLEIMNNVTLPKDISLVYYYTHRPNTIIEISKEDFEKKIASIMHHKSQIDESFEGIKMYLYYKASTLGREIGSLYAEGYFAMAPSHQHCFLEKI